MTPETSSPEQPDIEAEPDLEHQAVVLLLEGKSQLETADALVKGGAARTDARHHTEISYRKIAAELDAEAPIPSSLPRAIAGGLTAAIAAGIVWGLIVWQTGYEIGFAAWGVGLLAGYAVLLTTGGRKSRVLQVIAVVSSLLGILIGKYLTIFFVARDQLNGDLGILDPGLIEYIRANPRDVFSLIDLVFAGFAIYTAWNMLEPTRTAFRREPHA